MLTEREQFKVEFLKTCAERGLTLEETHQVVKLALARIDDSTEKDASLTGVVQSLLKPVGDVGAWGAKTLGTGLLLAPIGVGALGGYMTARSRGKLTDEDIREAKKRELISAYGRSAEEMERKMQVAKKKRLRRSTPVRSLV